MFKKPSRNTLIYIVLAFLFLSFLVTPSSGQKYEKSEISAVLLAVEKDQVKATEKNPVVLENKEQQIFVELKDGRFLEATFAKEQVEGITDTLKEKDLPFDYVVTTPSIFASLLATFLPFILILALILFFINRAGSNGPLAQIGKSRAKLVDKDTPKTTFKDVAGADEAIEELNEIKEFLSSPEKFQAIGAKIPKGVLLYGPPGTGKTLLARAVAGEANVPFYSLSGSDFVEMFVGVGAKRVRDLFQQAKDNAPAIIFIDEIDAVGRQRGAGMGGGHDEREQTLNQMLVEMDGFDTQANVLMIAATNRPDILDPALLRPGRFDRQIGVDRPDMQGRKQILEVHSKGKPLETSVDLEVIARRTPGFTGADLANVVNEAALLTARLGGKEITTSMLEEAIDRVIAGPQRKTRLMSEKEKTLTAYHEAGHALVAHALPNTDPVHKITILPRGRALGYTMVLPTEDKYSQTRAELLDTLSYALGGRAAEELVFHDVTTGASNDIEKATATARSMVMEYGMSERLGTVHLGSSGGEVFLGRDMGRNQEYSESVASIIDEEVKLLLENAHNEAWEILVEYRDILDEIVLQLLDKETLSKEEVAEIFKEVGKRPSRAVPNANSLRPPSSRPPVSSPAPVGPKDVKDL